MYSSALLAKWDETNLLRLVCFLRMTRMTRIITIAMMATSSGIITMAAIASAEKPFVLLGAEKETNQSKFQDLYTYDCIHLLHHSVQKLC